MKGLVRQILLMGKRASVVEVRGSVAVVAVVVHRGSSHYDA